MANLMASDNRVVPFNPTMTPGFALTAAHRRATELDAVQGPTPAEVAAHIASLPNPVKLPDAPALAAGDGFSEQERQKRSMNDVIQSVLTMPEPARVGRPKGSPRVPGSGRQPGTPNKVNRNARDLISAKGKPLEFLCDVVRGRKIRIGHQAGPGEPEYRYPTFEERLRAAMILSAKVAPDLKAEAIAIGNPDGSPIIPAPLDTSTKAGATEAARRIAFILGQGLRAAERAETIDIEETDQ